MRVDEVDDDEIRLRSLARLIWLKWRLIGSLVVFGAAIGALVNAQMERYVARGFVHVAATISEFKTLDNALRDPAVFSDYLLVALEGVEASSDALSELVRTDSLEQALQPEFTVSGRERQDLGMAPDHENALIGYRLTLESREPFSERDISFFADYVSDTAIRTVLQDELESECYENGQRLSRLLVEELDTRFAYDQMLVRAQTLRDLLENSKGIGGSGVGVISIQQGLERYLPLPTQLSATEIAIQESKLATERRAREMTATDIRKRFYCAVLKRLSNSNDPSGLIETAVPLLDEAIGENADGDAHPEVLKAIRAELEQRLAQWRYRFVNRIRLSVSPDSSLRASPAKSYVRPILLGALLGAFMGFLSALVSMWWALNKDYIKAPRPD